MTWSGGGHAAIIGVGFSEYSRTASRSLGLLVLDSCRAALYDAGVKSEDVDAVATYPDAPYGGAGTIDGTDVVTCDYVINRLRLNRVEWFSQNSDGMLIAAFIGAVNAIVTRRCDYALVWRGLSKPSGTYGLNVADEARGKSQFTLPYGCSSPVQWHALAYQRYLHRYGASRADMATLAINSRHNANLNENAILRSTPMAFDDYITAPPISDPLCLFDCDIPMNGAIAFVLTRVDLVPDRRRAAVVLGYGQSTRPRSNSLHYTLGDYIPAGAEVGRQMWSTSGINRNEVDVAELYDGFSPTVYYWLESLGFCERGGAPQFIQGGRIEVGGELPVNTHGGSLSAGRMHGAGHLAEAVLQLTGRAGSRQVNDCKIACVTIGSPLLRGGGLVLAGARANITKWS